mmetsp:Transcript_20583/g.22853  ORF Transcript_20583/g.22853 Transcript_20583/m.22853 type:complete len:90 (-) Transcript_20583:552-821(-)
MATTKRPAIINGVAHTILTVSNWEKAYPYYKKLLNFFGLTCVFDPGIDHKGQDYLYFVGGRTAIGITRVFEFAWLHWLEIYPLRHLYGL